MIRVVEKRGGDCRLHYWFYPDSFDVWMTNFDAKESEKRDETFQGIWHVAANWIFDTDLFNEWMNEEDYEIDEDLVGMTYFCTDYLKCLFREKMGKLNLKIVFMVEKPYQW
jgi:hypothetical protein